MSLVSPLCCGFVKAAVFQLFVKKPSDRKNYASAKLSSETYKNQYQFLEKLFPNLNVVTYNNFKRNGVKVKESLFKLGKRSTTLKEVFMDTFSMEKWGELSEEAKKLHSADICKGCVNNETYRVPLSSVPIMNTAHKRKAEENGLFQEKKFALKKIFEQQSKN